MRKLIAAGLVLAALISTANAQWYDMPNGGYTNVPETAQDAWQFQREVEESDARAAARERAQYDAYQQYRIEQLERAVQQLQQQNRK